MTAVRGVFEGRNEHLSSVEKKPPSCLQLNILIKDVPNQFNTSHAQQLDLIGIGSNRHKTYSTGKVVYTGLTRHATADRDALAALGKLLAFEVHHGLRLIEQIRSVEKDWIKVKMPGCARVTKLKQNKSAT